MFAAKSGNLEVVKYSIDKGADVNSKPMNHFHSPEDGADERARG